MEKKKVPIEKDVDIEFEYKVYMVYDFLKKNMKFVIAGVILFILLLASIFYYRYHTQQILNKSSLMAYNVGKLYSEGKKEEAKKLIEKLKKEYPSSPFVKIAIAYELLMKKDGNSLKVDDLNKLQTRINSDQLNAALTEFRGYLYYKNKKYGKTLTTIRPIDQRFFNYVSALTLKAFSLKNLGEEEKAKNVFNEVFQLSKYDYFKLIAKENL